VIGPELKKGNIVISERYLYSSLAYQSTQGFKDIDWLLEVNSQALVPDLVIFVFSDIPETLKRIEYSLRKTEGKREYFEQQELQKKILRSYFDIFRRFKAKGKKHKFFQPELITINNDGSILKYQKKLEKGIRRFLSKSDLSASLLRRNTVRYKKFDNIPVDTNFKDEEVLKKFLRKTLEYSFRWELHPENLPKTFVTRNMVNIVKHLVKYNIVIHKTVKQLHSEIDIQIGYGLDTFRRIMRGFRDTQMIESPGMRRRVNYFIDHKEINDPEKMWKLKDKYLIRLKQYRKTRARTQKMVLSNYFYQLGAFLTKIRSPLLYAFIVDYTDKTKTRDIDEYIENWIRSHFDIFNE